MGKGLTNFEAAKKWDSLMQANYGTPVISLARGKGLEVWDVEGKKYLDLLGGIATNLLGHNHPKVTKAITRIGWGSGCANLLL